MAQCEGYQCDRPSTTSWTAHSSHEVYLCDECMSLRIDRLAVAGSSWVPPTRRKTASQLWAALHDATERLRELGHEPGDDLPFHPCVPGYMYAECNVMQLLCRSADNNGGWTWAITLRGHVEIRGKKF